MDRRGAEWDVAVEYLEATAARMLRARPSSPDRTPIPAAWLHPLRLAPSAGTGGVEGAGCVGEGLMRLENLVGQLQSVFQEDVAQVTVDHTWTCALASPPLPLADMEAAFARGLTVLRASLAVRSASASAPAPPPQAPAPTFNVEAPEFVPGENALNLDARHPTPQTLHL